MMTTMSNDKHINNDKDETTFNTDHEDEPVVSLSTLPFGTGADQEEATASGGVEEPAAAAAWIIGSSSTTNRRSASSRAARRFLPWILVFFLLIVVALVGIVVAVTRSSDSSSSSKANTIQNNDQDLDDANDTSLLDFDVPTSRFQNPTTAIVTWKSMGQVILEQRQPSTAEESEKDHFWQKYAASMDMSDDGTRLVLASPYYRKGGGGYVEVYHYNNNDNDKNKQQWMEMARLTAPFATLPLTFGRSVSMAGNGQRIVIGAQGEIPTDEDQFPGKVLTYNWDNNNDDNDGTTTTWQAHDQPILEKQVQDNTGKTIDLNHHGSMLAVGAPNADGSNLNEGQVRFYHYPATNGVAWKLYENDVRGSSFMDRVGVNEMAMSADGRTLLAGNPLDFSTTGATQSGVVWAWRRDDDKNNDNANDNDDVVSWSRLGSVVKGPGHNAALGRRVAVSANGNIWAAVATINGKDSIIVYALTRTTTSTTTTTSTSTTTATTTKRSNTNEESASSNNKSLEWKQRGQILTGWSNFCLAADGNLLLVTSSKDSTVAAYQYELLQQAENPNGGTWVPVGAWEQEPPDVAQPSQEDEDYDDDKFYSKRRVACSANGHVIAIADSPVNATGTVHVWQAVEASS